MTLNKRRGAAASTAAGQPSEADLIRLCVALGALEVGGPLSASERALVEGATSGSAFQLPFEAEEVRSDIEAGQGSGTVKFSAGTCNHCGGKGYTTWPSSGTQERLVLQRQRRKPIGCPRELHSPQQF